MTSYLTTKGVLSILLTVAMVLSVIGPAAATPAVTGYQNNTERTDYNSQETDCKVEEMEKEISDECIREIAEDTDSYSNIQEMFEQLSNDEFMQGTSSYRCTEAARIGDKKVKYCRYSFGKTDSPPGNGQGINNSGGVNFDEASSTRGVQKWYRIVSEADGDHDEDDSELEEFTEFFTEYEATQLKHSVRGNYEYNFLDDEVSFYKQLNDFDEDFSLGGNDNDEDEQDEDEKDEEDDPTDRFLGKRNNKSTEGSVIDYDLDSSVPISVYPSKFKDSSTPNELYEQRNIPTSSRPIGDLTNFRRITSPDGLGEIQSLNDQLAVGFGFYRIPDAKTASLFIDATDYPSDVQLKIMTLSGDVIETTEIQKQTVLSNDSIDYINDHNSIYVALTSSSETDFNIACMTLTTSETNPTECEEGKTKQVIVERGTKSTFEGTYGDIEDDTQTDEKSNTRSGSVLNYDISNVRVFEQVRYLSTFADGDKNDEYLERSYYKNSISGSLQGNIVGYPNVVDSDNESSATVMADDDGLNTVFAVDDVPIGMDHVFVMRYRVTSGEIPRMYVETTDGHKIRIPKKSMKKSGTGMVALKLNGLTESLNNNGLALVHFKSSNKDTQLEVYCASIISTPKSEKVDCNGSNPQGNDIVDNEQSVENFAPAASISASSKTVNTTTPVELSAAQSYDSDGDIQKYEWEIDGKTYDDKSVEVELDEPGTYNVELTVTDDDGKTETTTTVINVNQATFEYYEYDKKETELKTKNAKTAPGPEWSKGKLVKSEEVLDHYKTKYSESSPGPDWSMNGIDHKKEEVVDVKYRKQNNSPGSDWSKIEKVGEQVESYDYTESRTRPGSDWEKVKKVGETVVNRDYKQSRHDPGSNWEKVKKVGETVVNRDYKQSRHDPGSNWEKVKKVGETVVNRDYKQSRHDPGSNWEKVKKVGETVVNRDYTESRHDPGSGWEKVKKVGETVVNRDYKESRNDPGSGWEKVKKVGETVVNRDYTESRTRPGSGWEKVEKVGETVVNRDYKESRNDPGSGWERVKKVGETVVNTKYKESTTSPGSDWSKVEKVGETVVDREYRKSDWDPGSDWEKVEKVGEELSHYKYKTLTYSPGEKWEKVKKVGEERSGYTWTNAWEQPGENWFVLWKLNEWRLETQTTDTKTSELPWGIVSGSSSPQNLVATDLNENIYMFKNVVVDGYKERLRMIDMSHPNKNQNAVYGYVKQEKYKNTTLRKFTSRASVKQQRYQRRNWPKVGSLVEDEPINMSEYSVVKKEGSSRVYKSQGYIYSNNGRVTVEKEIDGSFAEGEQKMVWFNIKVIPQTWQDTSYKVTLIGESGEKVDILCEDSSWRNSESGDCQGSEYINSVWDLAMTTQQVDNMYRYWNPDNRRGRPRGVAEKARKSSVESIHNVRGRGEYSIQTYGVEISKDFSISKVKVTAKNFKINLNTVTRTRERYRCPFRSYRYYCYQYEKKYNKGIQLRETEIPGNPTNKLSQSAFSELKSDEYKHPENGATIVFSGQRNWYNENPQVYQQTHRYSVYDDEEVALYRWAKLGREYKKRWKKILYWDIYKWRKPVYDDVYKWVNKEYGDVYKWEKDVYDDVYKWVDKDYDDVYKWVDKDYDDVYKWVDKDYDDVYKWVNKDYDDVYQWRNPNYENVYKWKKEVTETKNVYEWTKPVYETVKTFKWTKEVEKVTERKSKTKPTGPSVVSGSVEKKIAACDSDAAEELDACDN